jgi:hypothetical protein
MGKTSFRRKSGNRGFRHFCLGWLWTQLWKHLVKYY